MITVTARSSPSTMKYFLLLFLVGFASAASLYDASRDETVRNLLVASSIVDHLDTIQLAAEGEDGETSEWEKKLRDTFEKLLERVKDAIEKGKTVKEDVLEKLKEVREKLKEEKGRLSDKAKELLEKIKEKARNWIRELFDKLDGNKEKRSVNIKDLFKKLKDLIKDKIDIDALKEKIENLFGKGSEIADQLKEKLKEKGEKAKQRILDFIDRLMGEDEEVEERSIAELWEKVKDYFQKINLEIKEKFFKFGDWVKEKLGKGLEHMKTKLEKVKEIAKELKEHAKELSKDVVAQGLEFLRPYKDDLGSLWDQLKETVKEVLGKTE